MLEAILWKIKKFQKSWGGEDDSIELYPLISEKAIDLKMNDLSILLPRNLLKATFQLAVDSVVKLPPTANERKLLFFSVKRFMKKQQKRQIYVCFVPCGWFEQGRIIFGRGDINARISVRDMFTSAPPLSQPQTLKWLLSYFPSAFFCHLAHIWWAFSVSEIKFKERKLTHSFNSCHKIKQVS